MKKFIKYFFICTVFIGSLILSTSYAWTLQEIADNLITLEDKGLLGAGVGQTIATHVLNDTGSDTCIYMKNNNRNGYAIVVADYLYICFCNYSQLNVDYNNGIYNFANSGGLANDWSSSGPWYNLSNGSQKAKGTQTLNNKTISYAYTLVPINTRSLVLGAGEEYGGSYLSESFEFNPVQSQLVNTSSGYQNVHAFKYDYSVRNWRLGIISEYLSDYPIIHMKLLNQQYVSGEQLIAEGYYNNSTLENTSQDIYVNNNSVYIKSRLLTYNVVYTLVLYPQTLGGSVSTDNYVGTFIFLPLNSSISGDSITDAGSGSYDSQNATNDILDTLTDTSDLGEALSIATYSGDSGDILHAMGYFYFNNPFYDFLINVFHEVIELFQAQPNNMQLSFTIHGNTYFVQSDDFLIPDNNPLKIFVSSALTVGSIFLIYQYFAKIIYALTCLDIKGVMDGTDVDMSIFM